MVRLSLEDWLVYGDLGPLRIGATQAELLASVGPPDGASCPEGGVDMVWKYGDLELLFCADEVSCRVFCVELHAFAGVPSGGPRILVDPWLVRSELPREQMLHALRNRGVAYREEAAEHDDTLVKVVVREDPRIHLDFITDDSEGWPLGLFGAWMARV